MTLIAGHRVCVDVSGEGTPIVMAHCALGRLEGMKPLAQHLDGTITLFDLPGHGRSADWDGNAEYQGLVAQITASLCEGPAHVIGHSFGATAALRVAVERPDLVSRLTLIEPVYFAAAKGSAAHTAHAAAFRPFIGAMLTGDEARAAQHFNTLWGAQPWDDLSSGRQRYLTDRIHLIVAGAAAIEEDADGVTSATRLGALTMPVTLVRGSATQPVVAAIHATLVQRIPQATDNVVDGAAHMVPLTHATEVAAIIRAAA